MTVAIADPIPLSPPSPAGLEGLARHALTSYLRLRVAVKAPTWHRIVFGGQPIKFRVPRVPDAVIERLEGKPEAAPGDIPAARAAAILDAIRGARPRGTQPRSVSGRRPLPPPRDALAAWNRRLFLALAGPAALRLLAAAGYLTTTDVAVMEALYPAGVDGERLDAVKAAGALTGAAARNGVDAALPPWLNDQLLTLMGERSPAEFYAALYDDKGGAEEGQGGPPPGPSVGAPPSQVVDQTKPPEGP